MDEVVVSNWLLDHWGIALHVQEKLVFSIIAFIIILFLRKMTISIFLQRKEDVKERYYYMNAIRYTYSVILILILVTIWLSEFRSLATILGLVGAALTIALKDPIVNLAGWLFILVRHPFKIGDRVQMGEHRGDVIDIRLFQFTINEIGNWVHADQSTGRIIHIPNGIVFTSSQANYSQGFSYIWNEMNVTITFESDWKLAKTILDKIIHEHTAHMSDSAKKSLLEVSKKFMIIYSKLTPIVYTTVKDSGVCLFMRYLVDPKKRRTTENLIWEDILIEFAKHKSIQFAYPTQRILMNDHEVAEEEQSSSKK
jgi:small-conductance mechanosensitive channel